MTVRELISELSKLDLDKGIWVFYDGGYEVFPPIPDGFADFRDIDENPEVSIGDYIIYAN